MASSELCGSPDQGERARLAEVLDVAVERQRVRDAQRQERDHYRARDEEPDEACMCARKDRVEDVGDRVAEDDAERAPAARTKGGMSVACAGSGVGGGRDGARGWRTFRCEQQVCVSISAARPSWGKGLGLPEREGELEERDRGPAPVAKACERSEAGPRSATRPRAGHNKTTIRLTGVHDVDVGSPSAHFGV